MDMQRDPPAELTERACHICSAKKKRGCAVPQPADVPEPLRDLNHKVIDALRPLDIDVGEPKRAPSGYCRHATMIRFAWAEDSVEDKIAALGKEDRKLAQRAYKFLMEEEGPLERERERENG